MLFQDRFEAGRVLASKLQKFSGRQDVVVLALPRGGVPVGYEVAQALRAPLDVFLVRKLGTPGQEELAMGALAPGGVTVLNREVIQALEIPQQIIDAAVGREQAELERREREYREGRPAADVKGRAVIVVDDGVATGSNGDRCGRPCRRAFNVRGIPRRGGRTNLRCHSRAILGGWAVVPEFLANHRRRGSRTAGAGGLALAPATGGAAAAPGRGG